MGTPIPNLHGTPMHMTAVELYQRHHGDTAARCVRCGERAPCRVRSHAALVIAAAGEDPRWYDGRISHAAPPARGQRAEASVRGETLPDHSGYYVGGRAAGRTRGVGTTTGSPNDPRDSTV